MKKIFLAAFGYWLAYFFLLLAIGLLIHDMPFVPSVSATFGQIGDRAMYSDPLNFAAAALDIRETGWIRDDKAWIFSYWPPGFMFLEAGVLRVVGMNGPFIFALQVLSCAAVAGMLCLQRRMLRALVGAPAAFLLPLVPFVFLMPRIFLLAPFGVLLGESFSIAFFISAGMLMLLAAESRWRLTLAVLSGLLLALSAYFRSQYESLVMASTGLAVPLVLWCWWRRSHTQDSFRKQTYALTMQIVVVALLVAQVGMLPWRLHNYLKLDSLKWVQTSTHIYLLSLRSDQSLIDEGQQYFVDGGGTVACHVEPAYCDQKDPSLFFKAFMAHPVEWYAYKLPRLSRFWGTFPWPREAGFPPRFLAQETVNYWIYLLVLVATIPLLLLVRAYRWWLLLTWSVASLFAAYVVFLSFAHYESRYLYLLKIFTWMTCTYMLALWWSLPHRLEAASESKTATAT